MKGEVDCRFPLFAGGDQHRFDYAVFLLNKNIEQVGSFESDLIVVNEFSIIACDGFEIDIGESKVFDVVSDSNDISNVASSACKSEENGIYPCEKGPRDI